MAACLSREPSQTHGHYAAGIHPCPLFGHGEIPRIHLLTCTGNRRALAGIRPASALASPSRTAWTCAASHRKKGSPRGVPVLCVRQRQGSAPGPGDAGAARAVLRALLRAVVV